MRTLVTGGAGFIGSNLTDLLISEGHHVVVVDNLSSGKLANLREARESDQLTIIEADLLGTDFDELFKTYNPEVIFHLAAQIDVRASVRNPIHDAETNILATIRIAEAARKHGVRKIVFTSSGGSIYGETDQLPVSEEHSVDPHSQYAASKLSGEIYLNTYRRLYGLECTHIALSNVYGPRQNPDGEAGVVAIFSQRLLTGQPTVVFGNGGNTRDYVYVSDVVQALYLASGNLGGGVRFNIGTSVETSDRELHTLVAAAIGTADSPEFAPARHGDVPRSALAHTKATHVLGWRPETSIEAGVRQTVDFFRKKARDLSEVHSAQASLSENIQNESAF